MQEGAGGTSRPPFFPSLLQGKGRGCGRGFPTPQSGDENEHSQLLPSPCLQKAEARLSPHPLHASLPCPKPPGPGGSQKPSCMGNPWGTCFLQQHRMSQLRANPKAPLVLWESPRTLWHRSHLPKTWPRGEFPSGQLPARRTEGLPHGAACASPGDPSPEPGRCWLHVGLILLRVTGPWDAPHHHGSGETKKAAALRRWHPHLRHILRRRGSQEISSSSLRRVRATISSSLPAPSEAIMRSQSH